MRNRWNQDPATAQSAVAQVITSKSALQRLLRDAALAIISAVVLNWRLAEQLVRKITVQSPPSRQSGRVPPDRALTQRGPVALRRRSILVVLLPSYWQRTALCKQSGWRDRERVYEGAFPRHAGPHSCGTEKLGAHCYGHADDILLVPHELLQVIHINPPLQHLAPLLSTGGVCRG